MKHIVLLTFIVLFSGAWSPVSAATPAGVVRIAPSNTGQAIAAPGDASLRWRQQRDEQSWTVDLENLTDARRAVDVAITFTLPKGDWRALFAGQNDMPDWPDEGVLEYVYIRSQDSAELDNWNARSMMSIPFACLYDPQADSGFSVVGDDLAEAINTVYFQARRAGGAVILTVTRPRVRLEPNAAARVTIFFASHGGDWRAGLGWMSQRWREAFDVPAWSANLQSTRYDGASGTGGQVAGDRLTDAYWHDRLAPFPWRDTGIVQSRGFDPWYGQWVPESEPWRANVEHKIRHMIARPDMFPKKIIDGRPPLDAPWREQVAYINGLNFEFDTERRREADSISSLYAQWEWQTHDDVRALLKRIHDMGWYALSHFDIDEAFAPWLAQEFPESACEGTIFYDEPIWKLPDAFPGSRWERHIVDQARKVFEVWPEYDGLMLDQLYYENERGSADDGITVTADGTPASNLHRNNGRVMRQIHEIASSRRKVIWGNHARTSFAITRWCDVLITQQSATRGKGEDIGKYATIGTRGGHTLTWGELSNQNNMLRGWTATLWNSSRQSLAEMDRRSRHFAVYPYFSMMEMFPGRRWELSPHAFEPPDGMTGNIFRRADGNVLVSVVTYGASMAERWWRGDVPVTVRLPDAADFKAAYLLAADHLGPKKLSFVQRDNEIQLSIPLHRSVSMIVLAKTGRFHAVDAQDMLVPSAEHVPVRLWTDDWTRGTSESRTVTVDASEGGTVDGLARLALPYDAQALLPKPDASPGEVSTIELVVADRCLLSIAPAAAMIDRREIHLDEQRLDWALIEWPQPLSIDVGQDQTCILTLCAPAGSEATKGQLTVGGSGVSVENVHRAIDLAPGGSTVIPLKVRGQSAGPGRVEAQLILADGRVCSTQLDVRVVNSRVTAGDLNDVKSMQLFFDLWCSPGAGGAAIKLNDAQVGVLPGITGFGWTRRYSLPLDDAAITALAPRTTLSVETAGRHFKMRNPMLELTLADGRIVQWQAQQPRAQSVPADWLAAEGVRHADGEPMVWMFDSNGE